MKQNTPEEAPKIEYPLDYPIKVIGDNYEGFAHQVAQVIKRHDPKFNADSIEPVASKKATFVSLRFSIWATSKAQIEGMYQDLKQVSGVKMVL